MCNGRTLDDTEGVGRASVLITRETSHQCWMHHGEKDLCQQSGTMTLGGHAVTGLSLCDTAHKQNKETPWLDEVRLEYGDRRFLDERVERAVASAQ